MPIWLQALFSITVIAALSFVGVGAVAIVRSKGRILRPWLLVMVGLITLLNVYLLTAPVVPQMYDDKDTQEGVDIAPDQDLKAD